MEVRDGYGSMNSAADIGKEVEKQTIGREKLKQIIESHHTQPNSQGCQTQFKQSTFRNNTIISQSIV